MKRPVKWARSAVDDLKNQVAYIAAEDPAAARRVAARIRVAGAGLGELASGRPGRVSGTYERSISGIPYVIAYALRPSTEGETIIILRVIHTARDWPPEHWPE
ncbi:MAG: type II toxin-antitoxin system RelE/ParE family toxin [Phreatobacter sp.]